MKSNYMFRLLALTITTVVLFSSCGEEKKSPKVERHNKDGIPEIKQLDDLIVNDPSNANLLFERAKVFYDNEGYNEAIEDLQNALAIDSSNINFYHLLADSYLDNYKSRDAVKVLEDCLDRFPSSTPTQLKLSEYYLILKQYEKSIQLAGSLLEREPSNAEGYFMMGMNFRAMQDSIKAKNSFQAAVENDPELIDAWLILGDMYYAENNPIAIDYYNGALTADPNSILAKHSKAFYLQNNGKIDEAQKLYEQIILSDRKYIQAPINSGILYLEAENFEKARDQFNLVIANVPQNPIGHYYRGLANQSLGQLESAKEDFQNSINLDPTEQRVRKALEKVEKLLEKN